MDKLLSALPRLRGLPDADWRPRHRAIVLITAAHVPVLFIMASAAGMPIPHAIADVAPIAIMVALAASPRISQTGRSCFAALALVTCSAERSAGVARDGAERVRGAVSVLDEAAAGSSAAAHRAAQIAESLNQLGVNLEAVLEQ